MCLAMPAEIITIDDDRAIVNLGGIQREVSLALIKDVNCGDYVIVHVGYALAKLDRKEADKTLQLFASMLNEC